MTTTDPGVYPPPPTSPGPTPTGPVLRRIRSGRVGAGVAGGLGRYFDVDPVLFRVLFATAAFFGGAGVIAYLLAWAAIPEEGTGHAPIDGWARKLRERRIPLWVVAVGAALVLWLAAFSWWAPGPFFPVLAVVIILVVAFGRRDWQSGPPAPVGAPPAAAASEPATDPAGAPTVDLTKASDGPPQAGAPDGQPSWVGDTRSWFAEARAAQRLRRRRAMPIRVSVLITLIVTLVVLASVDAVKGIAIPVYLWTALGIVGVGLLVGVALRRTPWSLTGLLVPTVLALVAFGNTSSSLHDGIGQQQWRPTTSLASSYRLSIGQGVLDLTKLADQGGARTVHVTMAAGQVQVIAPRTMNLTVDAHVHLGALTVDGSDFNGGGGLHSGGVNYHRVVDPPAGATGAPVTVVVDLADGNIAVDHR